MPVESPTPIHVNTLQEFIQQQQDAGDRIILLGDFNTDLDNPQDSRLLNDMLLELHLTDIMGHHHPHLPPINTRQNGNRIDAIFACSTITPLIRRCGQGIFGSVVDSDHRPLYLDIPAAAMLRHPPPELFIPTPQGIHSTNPRECAIYISKLHDYLQCHNVFHRTERLSRWTKQHGMTDRLSRQWEALDRDITAACMASERQTGSHDRAPWSPKLHQAHLRVLFWRITVRQLLQNNDPSEAVAHIQSQLQQPPPLMIHELQHAQAQLKQASKELHKIRTAAATHRQQHLEERAALAAATQNADLATIIKRIIQAENTKAAYRILRKYLHSEDKGNIGEIEIQNEDGTTTLIDEPIEIFRRILQRDQLHFRQAEGTPFTTQPLQQFLGLAGETPAAQEFLRTGNLDLDFQQATLPETITLLKHMKSFPVRIPRVNTTITTDDYKKFFRKWKETTSTSDKRHL